MTPTADIVVIGGGVIGASAAFHLASKGAKKVVLVDKGAIGSGETHKSGGFIQTHWDHPGEIKLIAKAREVFQHWSEIVGGDCGWEQKGYLHVTGTEREANTRRTHQMLLDLRLPSHWLEPAELAERWPLLNIEGLVGGAYEPTSGWANALATTRSLAEAARARGVDVRENLRVTAILHDERSITGVATERGTITAPIVILAAGPWTPALHVGDPLPIQLERGQVCYFDRPGGLPDREIGFYDEVTGMYTHPDGDTNLVGIDSPFAVLTSPDEYKRDLDPEYLLAATRALAHRFPKLAEGATLVRGVVGIYDFTPTGQPIIDGPIGLTGYYVAAGFSGTGFKSAPATGLGLAELVLDGKPSSVDLSHLTLARFAQPATPGFPPALAAKLTELRMLLTDDEQQRLIPYITSLQPPELAAFAMELMTAPADAIAERLREALR